MNEQNEEALFATEIEQVVRATLDRQAASVPLQDPPVSLLLARGRERRRERDAFKVTGALAAVFAGVVGVHAASAGSPGGPGPAKQVIVAADGRPSGTSTAGDYPAPVPKNWKPGAKLPLSTYSSVPSWVQLRDAATGLAADKDQDHHVGSDAGTGASACLSLGSNPLVWPEGFYAEGTPLVVFDPEGRPVYVVDQGFTGVDGPAKLGFGDGLRLLPGLDLTHCPAAKTTELEPYAIAMIFADTPVS